jgi:oxalate---CoA ligase
MLAQASRGAVALDNVPPALTGNHRAPTMNEPHPSIAAGETVVALLAGPGAGYADDLAAIAAPERRRIVFLAEIPKGPTGKLQRIGLAAKLGLAS